MKIAILGVAHLHVDEYIRNLRVAGVDVIGVFDWDAHRGAAWARTFGVPWFSDLDELLAREPDGVVVCSETVHHRDLVVAAASVGAAVLCEKPLGIGAEDSTAIVEACRDAGVALMTAFPMRFSPPAQRVQRLLRSGRFGAVRSLVGTNQSVMPVRNRSWFGDRSLAGGGAMMDHVVHLADLFTWILGTAPVEVYALSNRIVHTEAVTVETSGLVVVNYPDGVFATIDCSWNRPFVYPSWGGLGFSVVADGGTIDADLFRQQLVQYGGPRPMSWIGFGTDTNQLMIQEFLDTIAQGRAPLVDGEDGLHATRVALAAIASAASGEPEPLDRALADPAPTLQ